VKHLTAILGRNPEAETAREADTSESILESRATQFARR